MNRGTYAFARPLSLAARQAANVVLAGPSSGDAALPAFRVLVSADLTDAIITSAKLADNAVTDAKLRDSGACSVLGRSANTSGDPADILATVNDRFLMRTGNALSFAALDALTAADVALGDLLPMYDSSAADNRKATVSHVGGLLSAVPGGRLTLTSGAPVTTSLVTGATNVYYTPYAHNRIDVWDGTRWVTLNFSETTLALGTLTSGRPYDVFGYQGGGGALALELLAWTSDTARATAITIQDGRYCKSGDKTRLYLGSFRTINTTQTEDGPDARKVWNMYHRVPRMVRVQDTTSSWTYTTVAYRQVRATSTNAAGILRGLNEDPVVLTAQNYGLNSGAALVLGVGIGVDSTTVNSAWVYGGLAPLASQGNMVGCYYDDYPSVGYHAFNWLEKSSLSTGTTTFYGSGVTDIQTGLWGVTWG